VHAPPDGYTLLLAGLSNAMNPTLYKKLNFNFIREIAPVASIGGVPYVIGDQSIRSNQDGPRIHRLRLIQAANIKAE